MPETQDRGAPAGNPRKSLTKFWLRHSAMSQAGPRQRRQNSLLYWWQGALGSSKLFCPRFSEPPPLPQAQQSQTGEGSVEVKVLWIERSAHFPGIPKEGYSINMLSASPCPLPTKQALELGSLASRVKRNHVNCGTGGVNTVLQSHE